MRAKDQNSSTGWTKAASLARLPLALVAMVATVSLASVADAAQRSGPSGGGGGKVIVGGGKIGTFAINPGNNGGRGSSGNTGGGSGGRVSGGDKTGGDKDRPHKPRWPKYPIITVGTPPVIGVATTPALGVVNPQLNPGGSGPSGSQLLRRPGNWVPPADEQRYVPDEVLVRLAANTSATIVDALTRKLNLTRIESFDSNGVTLSRLKILNRRSVPTVIRALQAEGIVLAALPNFLYLLQEQPPPRGGQPAVPVSAGDPAQYALAKLRLPQAHTLAKGDKVLIAVIDSAIDTTHPELAGMVVKTYDALGEKPHAHGTAVAGAIVANAKLMGAAPQARILGVTAFGITDQSAEGTTYNIVKGMDWAVTQGARVINMSFAGPHDPELERRIADARKRGIILIAAAGNAGPKSRPLYPAADRNVIAVTATDADDKLFAEANRGGHIAVAAPGVDILLPAPEAGYQVISGTSFAAAEVSGIVALMLERKPGLGHDGVRRALTATAQDLGPKGFDPGFGAGLVDAYRAIVSLAPLAAETSGQRIPTAVRQ
jgi:Subtilase family/Fervidolysin N-terminal prodomain